MTSERALEAARVLAEAWLGSRAASAFPDELRARSRAEAYRVQDEMARLIAEPVAGWKLGATSPAMRRRAGHDGPVIGRVFESTAFSSPARLPAARFADARVECEFAFRLRSDVAPRPAPWTGTELSARADLHAAIEIIGNRYPKGAIQSSLSTVDEIADNGAGIGFVFGPAIAGWRSLDLRRLEIDVRVDGGALAENFLGEDRCVPLDALAEAANTLSARGITIAAGQYVSTGAATNPMPVGAASQVTASFGPHALVEARFVP